MAESGLSGGRFHRPTVWGLREISFHFALTLLFSFSFSFLSRKNITLLVVGNYFVQRQMVYSLIQRMGDGEMEGWKDDIVLSGTVWALVANVIIEHSLIA